MLNAPYVKKYAHYYSWLYIAKQKQEFEKMALKGHKLPQSWLWLQEKFVF